MIDLIVSALGVVLGAGVLMALAYFVGWRHGSTAAFMARQQREAQRAMGVYRAGQRLNPEQKP